MGNRRDEWQRLGVSFNRMVEKAVRHKRDLEREVEKAVRELSKAYEELKETERFKSELFSNITHDFKTPITAIKGAVDLIIRKEKEENPYVNIIKKNVEKLSKMISDLLDCSLLESGQMELRREEGDLVEIVEDAVFMATPLAWEKGVKIDLEKAGDYLPIILDENRISQVVLNLLDNALKFSSPYSRVMVRFFSQDGKAVVSVEDFGPGIPKEEWQMVFEKFYRGDGKDARGGVGLGLAICKRIVEAHGGEIWVSKPHHKGIVFSFSLPGIQGEDSGG